MRGKGETKSARPGPRARGTVAYSTFVSLGPTINICHDIVVGVLVWFGHAFESERWELAGAMGVPLLGHKRELDRWNVDQS